MRCYPLTELRHAIPRVNGYRRDGGLASWTVIEDAEAGQRLADLTVAQVGRIEQTSDLWMPYRTLDPTGVPVEPVSEFFRDLQAAGRSEATMRSYGMALLRWFRFLWAMPNSR